ncbi:MAG: glycogen synthase, partial [Cyclobacteriaceae bacterium]|nr:glycogen synthase [Cyclobacteriaceae bacterium]MDX5468128.1 glycogen synthase [Cyclobacteriaceae bacterium]
LFKETKTVFGIYSNGFSHTFGDDLLNKVKMVDIDDTILAPLKSKDFTGFIKMGMEYADTVIKGNDVSAELNQLIEDFSKDKKFEISIEEEQQAHEDLYGIYTNLAG